MNRVSLRRVLARLDKAGLTPHEEFPAYFGRRKVRVVELVGTFAMIQPADDPRSWEIASTELIRVDPSDVERVADAQ